MQNVLGNLCCQFAVVKNDFVTKTDIINVLPCPILKWGVYESLENVNVDIL